MASWWSAAEASGQPSIWMRMLPSSRTVSFQRLMTTSAGIVFTALISTVVSAETGAGGPPDVMSFCCCAAWR